jgi:undecaprenyl diphosphate synthase
MRNLERATRHNTGLNLNVALNYGGRDEIVRTCIKIVNTVVNNRLNVSDLNESNFESFLDTAGQTNPDIIIRTAGEQRISNFLLWQAAYSEFYYTDLTWPEFTANDLSLAISEFSTRSRTYGDLKIKK